LADKAEFEPHFTRNSGADQTLTSVYDSGADVSRTEM